MNPYYDEGGITIYHGDCQEVIGWLRAGNVFITDPPYGTGYYETDRVALDGEYLGFMAANGTTAVFGWPERLVALCGEARLVPDEWVTWWPTNKIAGRAHDRLPRESEHIAIFGGTPGAESLMRPRAANSYGRKRAAERGLSPNVARLGDVWCESSPGVAANGHLRHHPNEKPVKLMVRLVQLCSHSDQTIVDPFMGSGTTLRAAKDLGRKAIGIEIEERYCEIAVERLAQEVLDVAV